MIQFGASYTIYGYNVRPVPLPQESETNKNSNASHEKLPFKLLI